MERVLSALTNRGQKSEHDDINVHVVVVSEISWFVVVEDGVTIVNIYSYVKCFLVAKKQPQTNFFDVDDD